MRSRSSGYFRHASDPVMKSALEAVSDFRHCQDILGETEFFDYIGGYYDALKRTSPRVYTEVHRNRFEKIAAETKRTWIAATCAVEPDDRLVKNLGGASAAVSHTAADQLFGDEALNV